MRAISFLYILLLASGLFSKDLKFYENSYAVIIGINNYQSEDITDLGYAVEDAQSIADLLTKQLDFQSENVHLITDNDATRDHIKTILYEVAQKATETDRIFLFYAGHGETIQLKNGGEVGYLIPVDGNRDQLYVTGLSMREFKEISEITEAKHVLYMIDVCYGGIMTVGTRSLVRNDFDDNEKYLKKITQEPGRQIITAGGKGETAIEKSIWGHSAFTKEILSGIENGIADNDQDGYITADELGSFLSKKVYITSEQHQRPVKGRYGSGEGEFVFINPAYVEDIKYAANDNIDLPEISNFVNMEDLKSIFKLQSDNEDSKNRAYSDFSNSMKQFMDLNKGGQQVSISKFEEDVTYLDSNFVRPLWEGNSQFMNIISPSFDINNLRFSSVLIPIYWTHRRVSGLEVSPQFTIAQLTPITFKLKYYPIYNFNLKKFYHYAELIRHPWGKNNHKMTIEYHDDIESNDEWMRNQVYNTFSSMIYGKDYMDHFHKNGLDIKYKFIATDAISLTAQYSNSYQYNLDVIKKYKNSIFKKATLTNRQNYNGAQFEDGKHVGLFTQLTVNNLNKSSQKTFNCTIEISDSVTIQEPKVYLLAESSGWNKKQYEMKLKKSFFEQMVNLAKKIEPIIGRDMIDIEFSSKDSVITNDLEQCNDSLYKATFNFEVTVNLPPGSHAYRFLIDNNRYQTDEENEQAIISGGKAVSIVSIDTPYRFDIGYEFADENLGGDFSYERLTLNYSIIHTLSASDATLFQMIGGWSKKQLPIQKLFYVGGEGSVRGFDYMDTKKFFGAQMLLAKMEYHNFSTFFDDTYIFYDAAFIGNKFDFKNPVVSYGIGISSDFRSLEGINGTPDEYGIIFYRTKDSNEGNWGVELMYNYFLKQLGEGNIILP